MRSPCRASPAGGSWSSNRLAPSCRMTLRNHGGGVPRSIDWMRATTWGIGSSSESLIGWTMRFTTRAAAGPPMARTKSKATPSSASSLAARRSSPSSWWTPSSLLAESNRTDSTRSYRSADTSNNRKVRALAKCASTRCRSWVAKATFMTPPGDGGAGDRRPGRTVYSAAFRSRCWRWWGAEWEAPASAPAREKINSRVPR